MPKLENGKSFLQYDLKPKNIHINKLYVSPDQRNQGIAKEFVAKLIKMAESLDKTITLSPFPLDNSADSLKMEKLIKFYEGLGFVDKKDGSMEYSSFSYDDSFEVEIINVTPHAINVNGAVFEPSGDVARVSASLEEVGKINGLKTYKQEYGDVIGLPEQVAGIYYIVSALVFAATDRKDVIAPATGHKDVVRNEKGHIVSVPGFLVK